MKQASALGVRSDWRDSLNTNLNKFGSGKHHPFPLLALRGTAAYLPESIWPGFLRSEKLWRRAVPVLIIFLLLVIAAVRAESLLNDNKRVETTAHATLSLIADVIQSRMSSDPLMVKSMVSPSLAEVHLAEVAERQYLSNGIKAYLIGGNGNVMAVLPKDRSSLGQNLDYLIRKFLPTSATRGNTREIISITSHEGKQVFAAHRILTEINDRLVHLVITQDQSRVYQDWQKKLNLSVILLVAVSFILLVILYVYLTQGKHMREAENLFIETNTRFDTALARGHCGLWDWDLARGRIVWSRSMYEMIGMAPTGKVMGFHELAGLLHPDDPDMMALANAVFYSKQKQIDHRFRIMHASGSWAWMRIRAELVAYKGTEPHLIGIAVDIGEEEALKQKTKDADVRLRDAIENISEAFVLWDAKKRLVMCNSKYQQMYQLPASAVTSGTTHHQVMKIGRKPRISQPVRKEKGNKKGANTFEASIDDGRWFQFSERRTRDGGFVSVGTDITQIKRNQEKLKESEQKQLATIADLRTTQQELKASEFKQSTTISDLCESQRELKKQTQTLVEIADNLNEEKERANAGNKAKSEFLANISHELRTPLNAIIGFSDIMRSNMFGPLGAAKYHEYVDDIHDSGNFLLGVINDVLDMSKIEAGRFHLDPEKVHLHDLLDETLRIIKIQADQAGISVKQRIPKSLELNADRRAVKQILLNLLSNAVKFTNKGGKICVTARALKTGISIVICDNGIGIPPGALDKLTMPFEQVQDQFTKTHKGSGLGLAIARSLSMLHGGNLRINSKPGEGTTVSVKLPYDCETAIAKPV